MNCLIIDDNSKTAAVLSGLLETLPNVKSVHKAVQPYLVRSLMACEKIDIIFIRVRLWNYSVFEKLDRMPVMVFLCGGKDKLTDKPGTIVPYRLREPFQVSELSQLFRKIDSDVTKDLAVESATYFFVKADGRYHRIFFKDLELIERVKMGYLKIFTKYTSFLVTGTITYWLELLPKELFERASDTLILPVSVQQKINSNEYEYRGRIIKLSFRFAVKVKTEMENWPGGL